MGYNEDKKPYWVRPFFQQFPENIEFKSCGYRQGKWVEFCYTTQDGTTRNIKLERAITNDVSAKGYGTYETHVLSGVSIIDREEKIAENISKELNKYDTIEDALNGLFGVR